MQESHVQESDLEKMRKIIEEVREFIEAIGEFKMEFGEEGYTIRLSRLVKGKVTYDPRTGKVVIVLPDRSQWRQLPDGYWDRHSLNIHVNQMEKIHEQQQKVQWGETVMRRINELAALSPDAGLYEAMKENVVLAKQLYDAHNKIQELEWLYMAAAAEACRLLEEDNGGQLKRAREDKADAEGRASKAEAALAHIEDEKKESDKKNKQTSKKLQKAEAELALSKNLQHKAQESDPHGVVHDFVSFHAHVYAKIIPKVKSNLGI